MKILILSPRFPSPNFPMNGNDKSEFGLALKQNGIDVEILVPLPIQLAIKNNLFLRNDEMYDGITTYHPWYFKIPFDSNHLAWLQRILFRISIKKHLKRYKKLGGKLIHSHSISLAGYSANYFKKLGLISVVTLHDHEIHDIKYRSSAYLKFLEKQINRSDQLLCVSNQQLVQMNDSMRIEVPSEVIPYGIKKREVSKKLPTIFTISTVCRLVKNKGVDLLIQAIATVNSHRTEPVHLIIVGSGEYENSLKKLTAKLDQNANIRFYGQRPNIEIPGIVANTHLFVLPSFEEALGLVYFEAMSVRTPLVGVIGQGISEYIIDGENGYLIPPKDVNVIVDLISDLIEKPKSLEEVGERGFQVFKESNVEWSKNANKHLEVYNRLLKV